MRPKPALPAAADDIIRVNIALNVARDIAIACGVLEGTRLNRGCVIPKAVFDAMANRQTLIENDFVRFVPFEPPASPEAA
jgi:hypothetical protein